MTGATRLRAELRDSLLRARRVTEQLSRDLDDGRLREQPDPKFSPVGWHLGHIAWQEELWVLRRAARLPPLDSRLDGLFDSFVSSKGERGQELPGRRRLLEYAARVRERCLEVLERARLDPSAPPLLRGGEVFRFIANHERQHAETIGVVRLLGGWPLADQPVTCAFARPRADDGAAPTDRRVPPADGARYIALAGARFRLGCDADPEAWDNERPSHEVELPAFELAEHPVTAGEWLSFIEAGGYARRSLWSEAGWAARQRHGWQAPRFWLRREGAWLHRSLRGVRPVAPDEPVAHISWYEAEAFARFAGARLPTEAEWELAAAGPSAAAGNKARWPVTPRQESALASGALDLLPVQLSGRAVSGVRGLLGGVWEWTASVFAPYPGFSPQAYRGYSQPWFDGRHRVARGGCYLTQPEIARCSFRNFFEQHIRELPLGLRLARG